MSGAHLSVAPARRFRPDIEGMRAVAVLMVVLYHAGVPGIRGGFVGVDVFFVISGFLITTHLLSELRDTGKISIGRFYARRMRRLLPAACVVTAFTVVSSWLLLNYLDAKNASVDGLYTTFFGLNFRLAHEAIDYQANSDPSPLQHYWSLSVEEQFYVFWPLLLVLLTFYWTRRTQRKGNPVLAPLAVGLVVIASFAWCVFETTADQPHAYFLLPARAWELGLGALVAAMSPQLARVKSIVSGPASIVGLVAVVGSGLWYTDSTVFPGVAAAVPVVGTALVLAAGIARPSLIERVLRLRPLQGIGRLSYGWYLWHWPLLILLPGYLHHSPNLVQKLAACLLGFWLAAASSVCFENPLRFMPALRSTMRSAVLGAAMVGLVVTALVVAPLLAPGTLGKGAAASALTLSSSGNTQAQITKAILRAELVKEVPANLTPSAPAASTDLPEARWVDGESCMVDLNDIDPGGSCAVKGTSTGPIKVLLTGDSHAYEWYPALEPIAAAHHWSLTIIAKSGCPLYDTTVYSTFFKRSYVECNQWRKLAFQRIRQLNPDLVVTSAFVASSRGAAYANEWNTGVAKTIAFLHSRGAPVLALGDTPWPNEDVPACIESNLANVQHCNFPAVQPWRDAARFTGSRQAAARAGAVVVDPTGWFCAAGVCPVIIGNTPVYHDQTHMTATYAAKLSVLLASKLPAPRS